MNSTGTSVNVHSQVCLDIKLSAYYRQDTSINGGEGDVNRKEFEKIKIIGDVVSCLLWYYRPDSNWYA